VKVKPTLKNFRAFDVFEKKNYTYLGLVKVICEPPLTTSYTIRIGNPNNLVL